MDLKENVLTKRSIKETVTKKTEKFELQLPDELNPKPKWTVDLPRGHKAEIFEVRMVEQHRTIDGNYHQAEIEGFKIVTRKDTGEIVVPGNPAYPKHCRGEPVWECKSLLAVRNDLITIAALLTPTTTTRKTREEEGYE